MASAQCCVLQVESASEFVGTFLLVFLGCASTTSSMLTAIARARETGVWEYESTSTAVAWGMALGVATLVASPISGAHLNPAVTLSLAVSCRSTFPKRKVIPYVGAQLLGAISAALAVLGAFGNAISRFEHTDADQTSVFFPRGADNSTVTAMAFANYFPHPIAVKSGIVSDDDVSAVGAFVLEAMGTMLFVLLMRVMTDKSRCDREHVQTAFALACCLSVLMVALGPVIQVSLNPARDLGPRIIASIAGWSTVAVPGPAAGLWAFQAGPFVGAGVATLLFDFGRQAARPSETLEHRRDTRPAELEHVILGLPDKEATLGMGSLTIDPGKGLHHSDFRDSPTPHGHSSYRLSSPAAAALTQTFLRQHFDLV